MRLFNKNLTSWIPLGSMSFQQNDFIVFVRGNKKTGMLYFKTKKVNGAWYQTLVDNILPNSLIDVTKQWNEIQAMINKRN